MEGAYIDNEWQGTWLIVLCDASDTLDLDVVWVRLVSWRSILTRSHGRGARHAVLWITAHMSKGGIRLEQGQHFNTNMLLRKKHAVLNVSCSRAQGLPPSRYS